MLWKPFLLPNNKLNLELAGKVWNRIFPVRRGIFEDKVATFWCVIHYCTPLKPNNWFDRSFQFKMTMATTLLACLPSCWLLFKAPTKKQLLYCLFCVCMGFFMFGFQVHEKQILSPSLIIVLLISDMPEWMTLFTFFANFSMWMLYTNDFNHFNYIMLQFATVLGGRAFEQFAKEIFYGEVASEGDGKASWRHFTPLVWLSDPIKAAEPNEGRLMSFMRKYRNWAVSFGICFALLFHLIEQAIKPPEDKPDLWRVLNNLFSLLFFMTMTVYMHFRMIAESAEYAEHTKEGLRKKNDDAKVKPQTVRKVVELPKTTADKEKGKASRRKD